MELDGADDLARTTREYVKLARRMIEARERFERAHERSQDAHSEYREAERDAIRALRAMNLAVGWREDGPRE